MTRKHAFSAFLCVIGACTLMYAYTRYWTMKTVLAQADEVVRTFLEEHDLMPRETNVDVRISPDTQDSSKSMLGRLYSVGGMYYWWNDSLDYYGVGSLVLLVGLLVPFAGSDARQPPNGPAFIMTRAMDSSDRDFDAA